MRYLLDTNICIYLIRRKPSALLQHLVDQNQAEIGVTAITAAELFYGVERSNQPGQNAQALERFLLPLEIVDFDYDAAIVYGALRAALTVAGTPIGPLDTLIAAQALSQRLTLITNNTREFARVPGLSLEDWTQ